VTVTEVLSEAVTDWIVETITAEFEDLDVSRDVEIRRQSQGVTEPLVRHRFALLKRIALFNPLNDYVQRFQAILIRVDLICQPELVERLQP
jgi:hypothetical protein